MLAELTLADFDDHVGKPLELRWGDGGATATLLEASALPKRDPGSVREPFAILLQVPSDAPMPQGTYRLALDEAREVDIFFVPIGHSDEGTRLEAIFG